MSKIVKTVGERIRKYRNQACLSQDELAERAGLHGTYIGQLERGEKNATIESIEKVACALHVPLEVLFENIVVGEADNEIAVEGYNLINSLSPADQEALLDIIKRTVAYKNM